MLGVELCCAAGYLRLVGPRVDALVRAPLLPAADAALVPAAYTARRVERDSANIPGTIKPDTAHVTVLSRSEFAAAQQKINKSSDSLDGCDGSDGPDGPEEQLLARLRPLLLDVPEPLGFGGVVKYSTPSVGSAASSFRNKPYGISSSSGGVDVASDHSTSFISAEAYFVAVCWPSGQSLRRACGLSPKDFHATLGFGPSGDVHDVPKGAYSLLKPRPWRDLFALAKSYIDAAAATTTSNDETTDGSDGAAMPMKPHAKKALPVSDHAAYQLEAAVSASSAALMALHLDASGNASGVGGSSSGVDSANHDSSSSCSSNVEEISDEKMARARAQAAVLATRSSAFLQLGDYSRAAADAKEGLPLLEPRKESDDSSEDKPSEAQADDVKLHNTLDALLLAANTASSPPPAPMPVPPASASLPLSSSLLSSSPPPAPPATLLSAPLLPKVPITRIFMDLDGVLADFDGGVRALTGKGPSDLSSREMWSAIKRCRWPGGFFGSLRWEPSGGQPLWEAVRHWGLVRNVHPDGRTNAGGKNQDQQPAGACLTVLTGLPRGGETWAAGQKKNWCRKLLQPPAFASSSSAAGTWSSTFGGSSRSGSSRNGGVAKGTCGGSGSSLGSSRGSYGEVVCCMSAEKHKWAAPGHLLVDDRADLGLAWAAAGGTFVHHVSLRHTLAQLQALGCLPPNFPAVPLEAAADEKPPLINRGGGSSSRASSSGSAAADGDEDDDEPAAQLAALLTMVERGKPYGKNQHTTTSGGKGRSNGGGGRRSDGRFRGSEGLKRPRQNSGNDSNRVPRNPCAFFGTAKGCHHGEACRFAHNTTAPNNRGGKGGSTGRYF